MCVPGSSYGMGDGGLRQWFKIGEAFSLMAAYEREVADRLPSVVRRLSPVFCRPPSVVCRPYSPYRPSTVVH
jgi:hypothetical protein